nr:hypothetical protein [Allomuricauda sp.]
MKAFFKCLCTLILLSTGVWSCSEEQDFDQFDDLSITPTLASSLFSVEAEESFINSVPVVNTFYSNTFNFDPFNENFVAERLLEGTINYEFVNSTSKPIAITIEFLDEAGNILDTEIFDIAAGPGFTATRDVTYGTGGKPLAILTTTSQIRVNGFNLGDNMSVSSESDPRIIMNSAAEFLFRLE